MDCVLNFVALCVVAEIDDLYAQSLVSNTYRDMIKTPLPIKNRTIHLIKLNSPVSETKWFKVVTSVYYILKVWYVAFYFYFQIFAPIGISSLSGDPDMKEWFNTK